MLAHSPKTTNLAAYASVASTSLPTQEAVTIITCPDDSDFLDSDAEGETFEVDDSLQHISGSIESRGAADATSTEPEIPLIYISNRLYYTYFQDPPPSPEQLNQGDGDAAAIFEQQQLRPGQPQQDIPSKFHWFNVDEDLVYLSFFQDWGPLNVALFYRFCMHALQLLNDEELADRALVFYSSSDPCKKANTSLLAMMYSMIVDRVEPADAYHPFNQLEFRPFRDAGYGRADYYLTVQDILYGVHRAIKEGLLDLAEFNLAEYEHYEQVQNGDWNWLTPSFLAFASPNDREYVAAIKANGGVPPKAGSRLGRKLPQVFTNTIKYFKARNVKLVVRLNNPLYDKAVFEEAGIAHLDLYFDDGSNPSEEILREFIRRAHDVIERGGAIAVHCKAGLGRTGVLIGAYLIWRYGFSASEVIGFMRIMRPGCVVGPQQHFMYQNFAQWIRWSVQDNALAIARKTIEAERAAMIANGVPLVEKRNLKRVATPDDDGAVENTPPMTPRAKKMPHVIPATAAPAVKPVPCVGQPRKSPSPSRKLSAEPPSSRLGGAAPTPAPPVLGVRAEAAAATAATATKTATTTSSGSSSSIRSTDLPRSASDESLASLESRNALKQPGTPSSVASLRNSWEALAGSTTPRGRTKSDDKPATPSSGRVLSEAQRWNNVTPSDRNATPTANRKSAHKDEKARELDPHSIIAQRRVRNHERCQSENVAAPSTEVDVFGPMITSPPPPKSPGTPSTKRVPSFAASPHVRATYGLKDSKSPSSPRNNENDTRAQADGDVKTVSTKPHASDAEVLGVLGINSQENKPVKPSLRTFGRVPSSSNSISPAKIRALPAAPATNPSNGVASSRSRPAGSGVPTGTTMNRTVTGVHPVRSTSGSGRPIAGTNRSASGSSQSSSSASTSRPASQATTSRPRPESRTTNGAPANARLASSRGAEAGLTSKHAELVPPAPAHAARKPLNRSGSGTVPISNSANAAMLAARANLKRPRPSPDVPQDGFDSGGGGAVAAQTTNTKPPPVSAHSAASRFGRNVRRRRSSLSAADIGMA